MMVAQSDPSHASCDEPDKHSHCPQSKCELLCVSEALPFALPDSLSFHTGSFTGEFVLPGKGLSGEAFPTTRTVEVRCPPDHGPPIYVLHAAFLI